MPTTSRTPRKTLHRPKTATRAPALPMPSVLFDATLTPDVVIVPERTVIALEGVGAPEGERFQRSVPAVYGIAYGLKFARKRGRQHDFKIGPLEARWWVDQSGPFAAVPRHEWCWELRVAVPDSVTPAELASVVEAATSRKGGKLEGSPEARAVEVRRLPSQRYGRVLHVGPYAQEGLSFARIKEVLIKQGIAAGNAHLEVYLGDPRRTKPERLKTVLLLELG